MKLQETSCKQSNSTTNWECEGITQYFHRVIGEDRMRWKACIVWPRDTRFITLIITVIERCYIQFVALALNMCHWRALISATTSFLFEWVSASSCLSYRISLNIHNEWARDQNRERDKEIERESQGMTSYMCLNLQVSFWSASCHDLLMRYE